VDDEVSDCGDDAPCTVGFHARQNGWGRLVCHRQPADARHQRPCVAGAGGDFGCDSLVDEKRCKVVFGKAFKST
jgi:hypothetical protein